MGPVHKSDGAQIAHFSAITDIADLEGGLPRATASPTDRRPGIADETPVRLMCLFHVAGPFAMPSNHDYD